MANTGLHGNYGLTNENIDRVVIGIGPGAYVLGNNTNQNSLSILYSGRADDDLAKRLKQHVGKYLFFQYGFTNTAQEAYEKECYLYHTFNPPDNKIHPACPAGLNLVCYNCGK
jgi:hypothetical protein